MCGIYVESGATPLVGISDEKTGINSLNEKRSLIPWGLRVPI